MKRLPEIQEESAQDSFLDVIANLVGVIIILVMLVGAKATRDVLKSAGKVAEVTPVTAPEAPTVNNRPLEKDLEAARLEAWRPGLSWKRSPRNWCGSATKPPSSITIASRWRCTVA